VTAALIIIIIVMMLPILPGLMIWFNCHMCLSFPLSMSLCSQRAVSILCSVLALLFCLCIILGQVLAVAEAAV
jgi:hypothetical protein